VCVCVCVCVCARACALVCVCLRVRARTSKTELKSGVSACLEAILFVAVSLFPNLNLNLLH